MRNRNSLVLLFAGFVFIFSTFKAEAYNSTTWRYYWHTNSWFEAHWDDGVPNSESDAWIAPNPAIVVVTNSGATCWRLDVEGQPDATYWRPELWVFNGATMNVGDITLGYSSQMEGYILVSNGTLNVSTSLDSDARAFLGGNGIGSIDVVEGGLLSCKEMYLGRFEPAGAGYLRVIGSGSRCSITDHLHYGEDNNREAGTCMVEVADSGQLTAGGIFEIETTGHTLTITNGATLSAGRLYWSQAPTLKGGGLLKFNAFSPVPSSLTADVWLYMGVTNVGYDAVWSLAANDTVTTTKRLDIAREKSATINCAGSLHADGNIYVAGVETGTVRLLKGTNTTDGFLMLACENNTYALYENDGGYLGTRSHFFLPEQDTADYVQSNNASAVIGNKLYIGYLESSKGSCTINGGSMLVSNDVHVGGYNNTVGATGTLDVAQGTFTTETEVFIRNGSLARVSGGTLTCADLEINTGGTLDLFDGTLVINNGSIGHESDGLIIDAASDNSSESPLLLLTNNASFTGAGTGALTIGGNNKAALQVSGYDCSISQPGGFVLGTNAGSHGSLYLTDSAAGLTTDNNTPSYFGYSGDASIVITNGGQLTTIGVGLVQGVFLGYAEGSYAEVLVSGSGSRWDSGRDIGVGWDGEAKITIEDGGVIDTESMRIDFMTSGTGRVEVIGSGSSLQCVDELRVGRQGSEDGEGVLTISNGTVQAGIMNVYASGRIEGIGEIRGPVLNNSLIEMGFPIGTLEIDGDFEQDTDGELKMDITGIAFMTNFDRLVCNSNVTLNGTLTLNIDDAEIAVGSTYPILHYAGRTGTFATTNINYAPPANVEAKIIYHSSMAVLSIAYEEDSGDSPVHYVSTDGTATWPFTNWATAAHTIQDAIDAAAAGDTVLVTNGIYSNGFSRAANQMLNNRVVIDKAVSVKSLNGPKVTLITGEEDYYNGGFGDDAVRGVNLAQNAIIEGFTITNGYTRMSGDQNLERGGAGILLRSGSIASNCIVSGNWAYGVGGGVDQHHGGSVYNSIICDNRSILSGGGILNEKGLVANCLIHHNYSENNGGGAVIYENGLIINCTVVENEADNNGGGIYFYNGGTNINSILLYNYAGSDGANWYIDNNGEIHHTCTEPSAAGTGNITNQPGFFNRAQQNYRLPLSSPAVDSGDNTGTAGTLGLDGNPRICGGTVDMGAYENGHELWITNQAGNVWGATTMMDVGGTNSGALIGSMTWTNLLTESGDYQDAHNPWLFETIALNFGTNTVIISGTNAAGTLSYDSIPIIRLYDHGPDSATHYVSTNGANEYPFTNWAQAAHAIQDAVNAAHTNDTVLATNGLYNLGGIVLHSYNFTNRVVIQKPIHLTSVNGSSNSFIAGASHNGTNGPLAARCIHISTGVVSGFTITNGFTRLDGYAEYYQRGGGVFISGGMVSNCIITGCSADDTGGGVNLHYGGRVVDCIIEGNHCDARGGGAALYAGGLLDRCVLRGNYAGNNGNEDGGGLMFYDGGHVRSCLFVDNEAEDAGGAIYVRSGADDALIENCTLVSNTAEIGGGVYSYTGTNRNTIMYCNVATNGTDDAQNWWDNTATTSRYEYACTTPLPVDDATGCITNDPCLDAENGFRPLTNSPCINAGTDRTWMATAYDLDLVQRIAGSSVDIGCHEFWWMILGTNQALITSGQEASTNCGTAFSGQTRTNTFSLTNMFGRPIHILSWTTNGSCTNFVISGIPATLGAGTIASNFTIIYCPTQGEGKVTATLELVTDTTPSSYTLPLKGESQPTAIVLYNFILSVEKDTVTVIWRTASEIDTVGFTLERQNSDGTWTKIHSGIIPAKGRGGLGAEYNIIDTGAIAGSTYRYRLTEIEIDGDQTAYEFERRALGQLQIQPLSINDGTLTICWLSWQGETYRVLRAVSASGTYECILNDIPATPPMNRYEEEIHDRRSGFYRIEKLK